MTASTSASTSPAASASPSAAGTPSTVSGSVAALQVVLGAEHAAVYGYAVIGVHLDDPVQIARAHTTQQTHRAQRDALESQIVALGGTPAPSAVSYRPAVPVTSASTAQHWALSLEQDCASGYRLQLSASATDPNAAATRRSALAGLTAAAGQALYWRALLTPTTPTTAFPGLG